MKMIIMMQKISRRVILLVKMERIVKQKVQLFIFFEHVRALMFLFVIGSTAHN